MTVKEVIEKAEKHLHHAQMKDSALLCLTDAKILYARGEYMYARERARKCLAYSVGISHLDYINSL